VKAPAVGKNEARAVGSNAKGIESARTITSREKVPSHSLALYHRQRAIT
jgi:hypothetical protein